MITKEDLEQVVNLARLEIREDEKEVFVEQLKKIIDYINQLNEVDTTNVQPMFHVLEKIECRKREDDIRRFCESEKIVELAPEKEANFFKVSKIIP